MPNDGNDGNDGTDDGNDAHRSAQGRQGPGAARDSGDKTGNDDGRAPAWRDTRLTPQARVSDLIPRMTLEEKLAQLVGVWVGATSDGQGVAPHQDELAGESPDFARLIGAGLGQLTRVFGTRPVTAAAGAKALAATQREIVAANRFGIPAMAHEECLAGFTAWGATVFPVPLAWGASFDPALVRRMSAAIGRSMRAVGVHQGLAPVLDVVRDARWGRVEETIGEDPYLVGEIGTAYVSGLESAGIVATLKHFAGYSAGRAGRNLAPVSMGPRELADVVLPPFERALREGGARSVMHSYCEIDGIPSAADERLLTGVLRERWGFEGTVVADYFGVSFLELLHRTAAGPGEAAAQALTAGVDVELPTARCYGPPLAGQVREGAVETALVDRALERVLRQKCELGLLDPDWSPEPPVPEPDLDPPEHRALARQLAGESVVLLANDTGVLPLRAPARVAVVGPLADDALGLQGCYSFPAHVGVRYPGWEMGVSVPTVLEGLRIFTEGTGAGELSYAQGCPVLDPDRSGFARAVAVAREAEVCVAVLGDRAGLFGRGTSGEGCDASDLTLPGVQAELLEELLGCGTPVVLVLVSGRPYALGAAEGRAAAIVQSFFPGEEGAAALADVLCGRVNPSGRLPVSVPRTPGGQPCTYLTAPLGRASEVSAQDPTALYPFGHGLSYTRFTYGELALSRNEVPLDGELEIACTVTNSGERAGAEVVQLYLSDPLAQVTRPWRQLAGMARVELEPGRRCRVTFGLHTDRTAFTGRDGRRIVEPGAIEVRVGRSSTDTPLEGGFWIAGAEVRESGAERVLRTPARVNSEV